jgi:hypothetical protein
VSVRTHRLAGALRPGKLTEDAALQTGQPAELLAGGLMQQILPPAAVSGPVNTRP